MRPQKTTNPVVSKHKDLGEVRIHYGEEENRQGTNGFVEVVLCAIGSKKARRKGKKKKVRISLRQTFLSLEENNPEKK